MRNILNRYKILIMFLTIIVTITFFINSLLESYNQYLITQIQEAKKVNLEFKIYHNMFNTLNKTNLNLEQPSLSSAKYDILKLLDNLNERFPINANDIKIENNRIYIDFYIESNSLSKNSLEYLFSLLNSKQPYFFINSINIEKKDKNETQIKIIGAIESVYSD